MGEVSLPPTASRLGVTLDDDVDGPRGRTIAAGLTARFDTWPVVDRFHGFLHCCRYSQPIFLSVLRQ